MGANSVTGTGQGSAEAPVRGFQQLNKVLSLDDQVVFDVDGQTHQTRTSKVLSTEEYDTGKKFYDGRTIYGKVLVESSFTVSGSYGKIPHGISDSFDMISAQGYVDGLYATYANYVTATQFNWYWTGSGSFPVHVVIEYVYD